MDIVHQLTLIIKELFGVGLGTVGILVGRKVLNKLKERKELTKLITKETNDRFNILEQAMISLQHDRLYQLTEIYLSRGYVTLDELDNLDYIFNSYRAMGGNGSGERRYLLVQKLPIVEEINDD